ncbi:Protein-export membrane protein SecF [uncultured archaeon]|nr:Protein-export membrane protein SecF [uncultured archaeon]
MKLPNIYAGNYSLLVVVPLSLILVSLFLLPQVPYGIDLRGGMLITLQLKGTADQAQIQSALSGIGVQEAEVRTYTDPSGNVAEIEISTDARMNAVDDLLVKLDSIKKDIDASESNLARMRSEEKLSGKNLSSQIATEEQKEADLVKQARGIETEVFTASASLADRPLTTQKASADEIIRIQRSSTAAFKEAKDVYKENIISTLTSAAAFNDYKLEEVSATLSKLFLNKVFGVAILSALIATVGIFLIFRVAIPSIAVLVGAFSDIIMALGAMALFHIPLTLASFATLMMLVGLSLDTDMMLTIKTVKRKEGTPRERAYDAFKTGFAMTSTVIVAFIVLLALGMITHIPTYYQIGAVAVAGLFGDLIATWMLNAVLVLWFLENKYGKIFHMLKR